MAKSFYDLFVTFVFFSFVVFSVFAFSINVQDENDADDPIVGNQLINSTYSNLGTQLGSYGSSSQTLGIVFDKDTPTAGFGTFLLFSVISAGKVFKGMILGSYNLLIALPVVMLGIDPVTVSIIGALLMITIIFGLWLLYKLGGGGG